MRKRIVPALLLCLTTLIPLIAQDVRVSISSREGYVGLPLDYQITVTGSKQADVPDLSGFDGFSVKYNGQTQSSQTSIINGQRSSSVTVRFSWQLTPLREGTLTIPSITVNVDGDSYKTPRGTVTITPPRELEGFKLVLRPESEKVFIDQAVTVDLDFYVSSEVGNLTFTLPGQGSGSREGTDFLILDSTAPDQASHDIRQIPIGDRTFYGYVSSRYEEGQQFTVLTIPLSLVPLKSGQLSLKGASVAFSTQEGTWPRTVTQNHVIPSGECTITAAPLPGEISGSPNGVLLTKGDLKIRADLSADKARPGDPLTLTLTLSGLIHPELCDIPPLRDFSSLAQDFSLPSERSKPKVSGNDLVLVQTIRPDSVKTRGVPPISFTYFDLEKEEVRTVSSEAIPLVMSSAGDLTLSDVENFQGKETLSPLRENDKGIRQNKSLQELTAGDRRGTTLTGKPYYLAALLAPPLLFLIFLVSLGVGTLLQRRNHRRGQNPRYQLEKALEGGEEGFASFEKYLRDRLFSGKSFHRSNLAERCAAPESKGLFALYEKLERERYGGGNADSDRQEILARVREWEDSL
ncbi:MAG: BatD family protein [Spirochaetales bacterium]|nr:BatD family protein [Spirochaetales bacterium]